MTAAEVVIVGGGVMGASVAYHLAVRGVRSIRVVERGLDGGQGSTGRATGGFRAHYGTEINVRLSLLSRAKLRRFGDELGVDPGYRTCGYLWVARSAAQLDVLRALLPMQRSAGLAEVTEVTAEDVGRLNPALHLDGIAGGVFSPTDGFIRPLKILEGYTEAAKRLGVRFDYGTTHLGFRLTEDRRIAAVQTSAGEIAAGRVVNAAGAWAAEIARRAGVDLPVTPLRRQVACTTPCELLPEDMPMTIFTEDGFHLRVRDGRVLLLWPTPGDPADALGTSVEEAWLREVLRKGRDRVPCLARAVLDRAACWAGLYEMSPDKHAILGAAPGCDNLYFINGSSGHGVMHSPALGQLLAEIIVDGAASTLGIGELRPSRFAEGWVNPGVEFL
jgi:sarcosine oxidase subunit beta